MSWVLIFRGDTVCTGSFWGCIAEAEERGILQRSQSKDGTTELAPRIPKGLILVPSSMITE